MDNEDFNSWAADIGRTLTSQESKESRSAHNEARTRMTLPATSDQSMPSQSSDALGNGYLEPAEREKNVPFSLMGEFFCGENENLDHTLMPECDRNNQHGMEIRDTELDIFVNSKDALTDSQQEQNNSQEWPYLFQPNERRVNIGQSNIQHVNPDLIEVMTNNQGPQNENPTNIFSGSHETQRKFTGESMNEEDMSYLKARIVAHPLYDQLLEAHVACLKVGTPLDQLPLLDLQLERADLVAGKYMSFLKDSGLNSDMSDADNDELTSFLAQFIILLRSFKKQLEEHVKVHAKAAVVSCWELEQSFISITGMKPGPGNGLAMSDDEQSEEEDLNLAELDNRDLGNSGPFGPLVPTDNERSIMERMREELKQELKNGYRDKITDVRDEIMRKRRAGKLPGDTTAVLKSWWNAHSKWPYPTEDEKALLVSQTGLELKQINNWFINQRKRNWHSGPSNQLSGKNMKRKQI